MTPHNALRAIRYLAGKILLAANGLDETSMARWDTVDMEHLLDTYKYLAIDVPRDFPAWENHMRALGVVEEVTAEIGTLIDRIVSGGDVGIRAIKRFLLLSLIYTSGVDSFDPLANLNDPVDMTLSTRKPSKVG